MSGREVSVNRSSTSQPPPQKKTQKKSVQVDIPIFLQGFTHGIKVADVSGNTVGECLEDFARQFPETKELLFDKHGKLLRHVDVYVNGKSSYPEESSKKVDNGDKISVVFLIIGG